MKRKIILFVALIPFFCASLAFSQRRQWDVNDAEKYEAQRFPARDGSVDWGLALSGGGPRSALFSIGAMKALYDQGYLDKIHVISSTSGGAYASYWLFTSYDPYKKLKFGAERFDNSVFLQQICLLQNKNRSNFLPLRRMPGALPTGDKRFDIYEQSIIDSFGNKERYPGHVKIDFLNRNLIRKNNVPYFIINTTIGVSKKDVVNEELLDLARVFEITPEYRGNFVLGFREWAKDYKTREGEDDNGDNDIPLSLSKSVATSGIPNFVHAKRGIVYKGKKFPMWDGGQAENLAALSLIRRGIKNIIIIDSEQDAKYEFVAYKKLQNLLQTIGIKFCVRDIDKSLKSPHCLCMKDLETNKGKREKWSSTFSIGEAKSIGDDGRRVNSTIYYIKMTDPQSLFPELFTNMEKYQQKEPSPDRTCKQQETTLNHGKCLAKTRQEERCPGDGKRCDCENIKLDFTDVSDRHAFYSYVVRTYSKYLDELSLWNHPITWLKVLPFRIAGKMHSFFSYNFPHTTTVDLNFFADQLEAFVGLGYLQTMKLEQLREK